MKRVACTVCAAALLALVATPARAQSTQTPADLDPLQLTEAGHVAQGGQSVAYVVRRLPPSSFPNLPAGIAAELTRRGCMIPQTYEAHRPENVVHASLEVAGASDWAVLCSTKGTVSLLIFFASAPDRPTVLATAPVTERLQSYDASGVLGFNWGIDPASPLRVHEAQTGLVRRPPAPNHDALADSVIEHRTVYHFFTHGTWTLLDMPE